MIKNLIFDLSGTVFKPRDTHIIAHSLILYMWGTHKVPNIYDELAITILERAYKNPVKTYNNIRLHNGKPVPPLICAWLSGEFTSHSALEIALSDFNTAIAQNKLISDQKIQKIVEQNIKNFFDPVVLAHVMHAIPATLQIIQACARKQTPLFILSNWDRESFEMLYQSSQGQEVFKFFNPKNIFISGTSDSLKPEPAIFTYFLNQTALDPATCFFIDDQPENIEQAQKMGLSGIRFSLDTINELTQKLQDLNFL